MTKKQNKVNTIYMPKYSMEQSKIYFKNGASIKILDYIKQSSMPMPLQTAILKSSFSDVLKLVRQYRKQAFKTQKAVKISYSCDVFATVTQTWHAVADTLACGCYNSINDIKKVIEQKRMANNESILKGYIKNLKFAYSFIF
nr:MAG TPA: hypothetical protein [Caudoviricetes sp.]